MLTTPEPIPREVIGIINQLTFPAKDSKDPTILKIYCPKTRERLELRMTYYCPVRKGDIIYATFIQMKQGLQLIKFPYVRIPDDKDNIIGSLLGPLDKSYAQMIKIYNILVNIAQNEEKLIPFLDSLAQIWNDNRSHDLLFMFEGIEHEDVKKLLEWWHDKRNLRRLALLGLSPEEIRDCKLPCTTIYQKCLTNPYTLPVLTLEKCDEILTLMNQPIDPKERYRGSIVRFIWKKMANGWTGVPSRLVARTFPDIVEHYEILRDNYEIIVEMETVYLQPAYKAEKGIADFIIARQQEPIEDNESEVEFDQEMSEEQQEAVRRALRNNLSIITGGGGVGKCHLAGTPILMFDGSIKKVEEIKEGDQLMGPDSSSRTVLSTCTGLDEMYDIIPKEGRIFTCNSPHLLTFWKDGKIGDISIRKYLTLSERQQRGYYLFHVPVEFPSRNGSDSLEETIKVFREKIPEDPGIRRQLLIDSYRVRKALFLSLFENYSTYPIELRDYPNPSFLDDIEYLILSLGIMATRLSSRDLRIYFDLSIVRASGWKMAMISAKIHRYQSFQIKYRGYDRYHGFTLSGDGRYLLGDFLVTHNTTCLRQVVLNLDKRRVPYALCSFTGRAVARIREVTNKQTPATLHRLIVDKKYQLGENLIDYECVIIDEASMVTTELLYEFLQYYRQVKRLILVGDVNQLEPIDWGCLFHQLLKSGTVPIYQLTKNFRVYEVKEELDGITLNSNALINHDPHYPFEFTETLNFSIIKGGINTVLDIIKGCFSSGIKVNQVVIITPYTRLFKVLDPGFQNIYNTSGHGVTDSRGNQWLVGDLVMLQENDDRAKIYNGETGTIKSTTATSITVDFGVSGCHVFQLEAKLVDRNRYQMTGIREKERTVRQLKLAYTLSIDKSQGSEYDFVILYIDEYNAGSFLYMNRIYTALTRAKRCVWVVTSDPEAFKIVAVRPPAFRCDNLARRLLEVLPPIIPEVPWGDEGRPDWGYDEDDY